MTEKKDHPFGSDPTPPKPAPLAGAHGRPTKLAREKQTLTPADTGDMNAVLGAPKPTRETTFADLKVGDAFVYQGAAHVKAAPENLNGSDTNAVRSSGGLSTKVGVGDKAKVTTGAVERDRDHDHDDERDRE